MRSFRALLAAAAFAAAVPAYAQDASFGAPGSGLDALAASGALQFVPAPSVPADPPAPAPPQPQPDPSVVTWVDVAKVIDTLRIPEHVSDLRAVTTDAAGRTYGFYFASAKKKTIAVYRNGRLMAGEAAKSVHDMQKPAVFRMTASGDLLYVLRGTDLYVNDVSVSRGRYSFSRGATSVHDEGGVLTFPEEGNVVRYDVKRGVRTVLHKHKGSIEYLRRSRDKIAYVLNDRGLLRMYRNGRRVSPRTVHNPHNFAVNSRGDVYFFSSSARGYALFRNNRSFVTGQGAGAYVAVDADDRVWHLSYARKSGRTAVRLQRDRSSANLLPPDVANVELFLGFPDGGYALRASFADDPSAFSLVRDGRALGDAFAFDYPYNDTHGFVEWNGAVVLRAHDGLRWKAYVDGKALAHPALANVWFLRAEGDELTVYATK